MNEFWGIVLGAALATAGGIIASFVAMWIKSIETRQGQKSARGASKEGISRFSNRNSDFKRITIKKIKYWIGNI